MRAEVALNDIFKGKPPTPEALAENFEREVQKLRLKVRHGQPHTYSAPLNGDALPGVNAHGRPRDSMAIGKGCTHAREDQLLLRRDVLACHRVAFWHGP